MSKLFVNNRKQFLSQMKNNSILIMFAGEEMPKRGDELYPFAPKRNFLYLTGIDKPKLIFTLHKRSDDDFTEKLYIERFDPVLAKWVGPVVSDKEAEKISGIRNYEYIDRFNDTIAGTIFGNDIKNVYMDLENRHWNIALNEDISFANQLKTKFPNVKIINAYGMLAKQRVIKSKEEISNIKKAIDITADGIELMMKKSKAGMKEYEIEAYFDYTLKSCGVCGSAFPTIAAAGVNATILHYSDNNKKTKDGDLILFDLGAQHNYYSADISRTFPVNGKFTDRQKTIYNIVLEGQTKVIDAIKPGVPFNDLNEILKDFYFKELKKIGLIEKKEEVIKYYYHGVSHMLGLETHDVGVGKDCVLEAGMVITVEPGLYIEEEQIGIRIEDDILVTEKGSENLSKNIIKTVKDIENFMKNE